MQLREISDSERKEIEGYLRLGEDDLYALLSSAASEGGGHVFSEPGQESGGRQAFEDLQEFLHNQLCQEWNLCAKIDDPVLSDNINLATAIADALAPFLIGFPPFVIASILIKIGVRKFCQCSPPQPNR